MCHQVERNYFLFTSKFSSEINLLENRPRLQLLPRSQNASSSPSTTTTDNKPATDTSARNASIFGCGKPRDERDPKIIELNKHIEEVIEKEQNLQSPTTPTTPIDFTK